MRKRQAEAKDIHEGLTEVDLDEVKGGQGIDIVRMPPPPRDPNEGFIPSDRQPFVD